MDPILSSLVNPKVAEELRKKYNIPSANSQDTQNIDSNLDIMLNRNVTSPGYGQVPMNIFPETSSKKGVIRRSAPKVEDKMVQADPFPDYVVGISDMGNQEPGFFDSISNKLSNMFTSGTPSAQSQTASTKTSEAPMATGTTKTPVATDTTQSTPAPQGDDFQGRMAATAFGNVLASLGAGMAGYSPASVNQMFQGLYGQLNQRQREKEERDPNSTVSKNYREMIAPYLPKGLNISDKSAFDLKQTLPFAMQKAQQEQQMEIARMNASVSKQNAAAIREYNQRRFDQNIQNKAFSDIEKEYTKLFSPEDADFRRSLYEARDLAKQIGVGKGTIQRLATGGFRAIAGPSGVIDPKASALAMKLGQLETYLAKETGEVGNLTVDERRPYRDNLPKINDANIVPFFDQLISTHEAKRKDRVGRFTAKVNRVNKNYGTDFDAMENLKDIEINGVTPTETSTPSKKIPEIDLKF